MPLILLALVLASPAFAQDEAPGYAAILDEAKAAISAKDYKAARALLVKAEAAAPANAALIQEKDLARLPFYRGLVEWRDGDKDTAALNFWRDAITVSADFQPEVDVLPEADGQDVYYALIGEVQGRESVVLALPEDPGDTMIFVDGRRMEAFDAVLVGTHFIQLRCGEGNVVGSWYTYGAPPPDYLTLCAGGAYPVAAKGSKKPPKEPKGPSKADIAKAEKEAAKKAAAEKAAADKAAADKAAAEKAAADKAVADKAAADKVAAAEKAAAEKAAADKAAADKAAADKVAAAEKAAADKAAADKAAADKVTVDADKAAADKAAADKAAADKAAADKAAADAASADKAAAEKASADKAAAEKASADKAAAEKASADKAAAEKASADKAAAEKAAADKAAAEKAAKATADKGATSSTTKKPGNAGDTIGWAMIAGGGAMIAGGGVVNFLVVNPAWQAAQDANADPTSVDRAEADAILGQFNGGRYATIGLIAAGVATAGVGVFLGPLDSHVFFTPSGVGLAGRW